MKRKGMWLVVLIVAIVLVLINVTRQPESEQRQDASQQPDAAVPSEPTRVDFTFASSTRTVQHADYGIRFDFPVTQSDKVNEQVTRVVDDEILTFEQDVADFGPSIVPGREYTLFASFEAYVTESYTTFVFAISTDTGGAHPNNRYRTLTFNEFGEPVSFEDALKALFGDTKTLQDVSTFATETLTKELGVQGASSGWIADGTAPTLENFEDFYIAEDALVILFEPYAIGPYVWSSREVRVPVATSTIANTPDSF